MSGSGYLCRRRPMRLTPDAAAEFEREACCAFIRGKIDETKALVRKGQCDEDSGDLLTHRLAAIADSIDAGLHLSEGQI